MEQIQIVLLHDPSRCFLLYANAHRHIILFPRPETRVEMCQLGNVGLG